jgi:cation diffusion facilitator family transporter
MKLLYKLLRQDPGSRDGVVITTSALGIMVNVLLAAVKIFVGVLTNSIAIVSEGVNNASDSASSLITIVGTKLSNKNPTAKHPFGYGRVEYLTSLVIAILILVTGAELLISSVKLILNPAQISVSYVSLAIVAASAVVKLGLGSYTVKKGRDVDSGSLVAVGTDCRNDSVVSAVTIASALVFLLLHYSVDAWAGIVTSVFILKSGWDVLSETVGLLLGEPADSELAEKIYREIRQTPDVINAADMMLHNYGPDYYSGSVNVEIDHEKTIGEVYAIIHDLQLRIMQQYGVVMVFGMYAVDTDDPEQRELRRVIARFVAGREHVVSFHALYLPHDGKQVYCDLVVDYELSDREGLERDFRGLIGQKYPGYEIILTIETQYV